MDLQRQEFEVLKETDHPNIMRIFEIIEDQGHYYVVSELMQGGELYDRIIKMKVFSERAAAKIISQILLALNYMHKRNIVHRDIKPENILLESDDLKNLNVKVTDFGFARFFDPDEGLSDMLGSPLYIAPEVIRRD